MGEDYSGANSMIPKKIISFIHIACTFNIQINQFEMQIVGWKYIYTRLNDQQSQMLSVSVKVLFLFVHSSLEIIIVKRVIVVNFPVMR